MFLLCVVDANIFFHSKWYFVCTESKAEVMFKIQSKTVIQTCFKSLLFPGFVNPFFIDLN